MGVPRAQVGLEAMGGTRLRRTRLLGLLLSALGVLTAIGVQRWAGLERPVDAPAAANGRPIRARAVAPPNSTQATAVVLSETMPANRDVA
jgi:hypothetical protein